MERLSPKAFAKIVDRIDDLIEGQAFVEAINLCHKALRLPPPDRVSINMIMERIKLARTHGKNTLRSTQSENTTYPKNYCVPKYQQCQRAIEEQHLDSLTNHIKDISKRASATISEYKNQPHHHNDTSFDREDIIQTGIEKTLAQEELVEQEKKLKSSNKAINNPFFARIDFDDGNSKKIIYISETNAEDFIDSYKNVYYKDWRSPFASALYNYQTPTKNAVFYRTYYGKKEPITRDIDLVAHYTINHGKINNCTYKSANGQASDQSFDDILQEKLESNSSTHMKAHADTLQKEQYRFTSFDPDEDLIIQGAAGSGKTVVALSRLVFLKYRENKNFSNRNILYISPNADFSEYVSDVSTELGETRIPIRTIELVIDDVFGIKKGTQSTTRWDDLSTFAEKYRTKKPIAVKRKFSKSFMKRFYSLCEKLDNDAVIIHEYNSNVEKFKGFISGANNRINYHKGRLKKLTKEQADFEKQKKQLPTTIKRFRTKISRLIERGSIEIDTYIEELKTLENDLKDAKQSSLTINQQIKGVKLDIKKAEQMLYRYQKILKQTQSSLIRKLKCKKIEATKKTKDDKKAEATFYSKPTISNRAYIQMASDYTVKIVIPPEVYFASICPDKKVKNYAYENLPYIMIIKFLINRTNGNNLENREVKHIVVDEAQDYTEPYFYFLRQAFPNAVFTILGDKNQNVNPFFKYQSLEELLPDSKYAEINIAYRSSPEIVEYCNHILKINHIHSKRESQNIEVAEHKTNSRNLTSVIDEKLKRYKTLGMKRISIITSSQKQATSLQTKLDKSYPDHESAIILPVYKAKGLEYDASIIVNDFKTKELLYVACARAKHALSVIKIKK